MVNSNGISARSTTRLVDWAFADETADKQISNTAANTL
jgi:hypothetical protein